MTKHFLILPVNVLALAFSIFSPTLFAADAPLKIGTTAAFAIPLEAAVEEADKQGLKVELVEFSDWIAPNVSLASGDIDVNYFQHIPFLENAKAAAGFELVPFAPGIINNVGLYSKKASMSCPRAPVSPLPTTRSTAVAACSCWPRPGLSSSSRG
jgi:D-methionine transport system substrate-binding protein